MDLRHYCLFLENLTLNCLLFSGLQVSLIDKLLLAAALLTLSGSLMMLGVYVCDLMCL